MKTYRICATLIVITLILTACGSTAPSAEHQPLKVGWSLWPGWYPLVIAQEKDFFQKHGVEVELTLYPLYNQAVSEFDSGKADAVSLVVGDVLPLTKNDQAKIVLITDNSNGSDVIMAPADVTSVADLRGKRIGVDLGTFGEVLVREMLKRNNLSVSDVTLVDVAPENLPSELGKTADAGHTYEPFASQATQKGYRPVFSSADTPGLIADVIVFHSEAITQRPDDVRGFVAAFLEAQNWWLANPNEAAALIAQATGQNSEDISFEGLKLFNQADNISAFSLGDNTTSIYFTSQIYSDFQIQTGRLSIVPDIDQMLDASFLP